MTTQSIENAVKMLVSAGYPPVTRENVTPVTEQAPTPDQQKYAGRHRRAED
jgi:hypothetical protein